MGKGPQSRWWLPGILLSLGLLLGMAPARDWSKSVQVLRRSGEFFIQPDGRVEVEETWEVRFRGGPFHYAFRSIFYSRLEQVTDWQIVEGEQIYRQVEDEAQAGPYTFWVEDDGIQSRVVWYFPETRSATRTFTLRYTLHGVLWVDPDGDRFFYTFIERDRGYPIQDAWATVHLPAAFQPEAVETATFRGGEASSDEVTFPDESTVIFHAQRLRPGENWEIGVAWPHGAVQAMPPAWQREEMRQVIPEIYRAFLALRADGSVRVTETWRLHFTSGPFTEYTRELSREHLDTIGDWSLEMDGEPCPLVEEPPAQGCALTVTVVQDIYQDGYEAVWHFPAITDATHTFTLTYTVRGAVAQGEQDQLRLALADFTFTPWPTQQAEVGLGLPSELPTEQVQVALSAHGAPLDLTPRQESGILWFTLPTGWDAPWGILTLQASWPGPLLELPLPAWQRAQQAELAAYHQRLAKIGLVTAALVLVLLSLAGVLFLLEPPLWPLSRPIPRPPDNLPPALAGVLLDREVLQRHLLATLWDLARRGYLRLEIRKAIEPAMAYRWRLLRPPDEHLRPYERETLRALFPSTQVKSCTLDTAQHRLADEWVRLVSLLEVEAAQQEWFRWPLRRSRAWVRSGLNLAVALWGLFFLGGCFLVEPPAGQDGVYLLWPLILAAMMATSRLLPKRIPPRTRRGRQAAARWLAYRASLRQLRRARGPLAQARLDEALAYAAAFGLAPSLLRRLTAKPSSAAQFAWVRTATSGAPTGAPTSEHDRRIPRPDLDAAAVAVFAALNATASAIFHALNASTAPNRPSTSSDGERGSSGSGFGGSSSGGSSFSSGGSSGGGSSGFG